jgi:hypothetical protein
MKLLPIGIFLLLRIPFSFAQLEPVPINQNGEAIVVNDCNFTVYYKSVGNHSVQLLGTIPPGKTYKETYQLNIVNGTLNSNGTVNGTLGGISIKLSSNQSISDAVDESAAFDASTITQFEYTYNPNEAPGLWYDISNVNGYLEDERCGPWPFDLYGGLILEGTSSNCSSVTCPPNNCTCAEAYTFPNDNCTQSCRNNNSLVLTLCSTTSDWNALEEALSGSDSGSIKEVVATDVPTSTAIRCSGR